MAGMEVAEQANHVLVSPMVTCMSQHTLDVVVEVMVVAEEVGLLASPSEVYFIINEFFEKVEFYLQ